MPPPNGAKTPTRWPDAKAALAQADIIVANLLFLEEHIAAILPDLTAARERCDAFVGIDRRQARSSS